MMHRSDREHLRRRGRARGALLGMFVGVGLLGTVAPPAVAQQSPVLTRVIVRLALLLIRVRREEGRRRRCEWMLGPILLAAAVWLPARRRPAAPVPADAVAYRTAERP